METLFIQIIVSKFETNIDLFFHTNINVFNLINLTSSKQIQDYPILIWTSSKYFGIDCEFKQIQILFFVGIVPFWKNQK